MKKRADGRYQKSITIGIDDEGKLIRKSIYARTLKELERKEDELKGKIKNGIRINDKMTFGEAVKLFMSHKDIRPATRRFYTSLSKHYALINDITVADLKAIHLKSCLADIKPRTKAQAIKLAKAVMNMLVAEELLFRNPFSIIHINTPPPKKKRALTEEERYLLLTAPTSKEKILCLLMLLCGLRIGEALAITRRDINIKQKLLTVNKQINQQGNVAPPKTPSSNRTVPVPSFLISELQKMDSIQIVPSYKANQSSYPVASYLHKLGIGKDVTAHYLRHTYATMLYTSDINVKTASAYLGHSSVKITLDIYTHLDEQKALKDAVKLDNYINKQLVK